jgi:hypothetical protein
MTDKERLMRYPAMQKFYSVEADTSTFKELIVKEDALRGEPFRSLTAITALALLAISSKVIFDDDNIYEKDPEAAEAFRMTSEIVFHGASDNFKNPEIKLPEQFVAGCFTDVILASLAEITDKDRDVTEQGFGQSAYYVACFTALGSIFEFLLLERTEEPVLLGLIKLIEDFNMLGVKFFEEYLEQNK